MPRRASRSSVSRKLTQKLEEPDRGERLAARNLVFSGTLVTKGTGAAVVYATGHFTEIRRIAGVTRETDRVETPIQRELRHFMMELALLALIAQTAVGHAVFGTASLPMEAWLVPVPIAFAMLGPAELLKVIG